MKLRLRSSQSKETLKIEVPNSCTLSQLRRILSETIHNSPSPSSIRLSLNRKDELQSDGEDTLQFLGIAAGDLIFFSVEQSSAGMDSNSRITISQVTDSTPSPVSNVSECSTSSNTENPLSNFHNSDSVMLDSGSTSLKTENVLSNIPNSGSVMLDSRKGETLGSEMREAANDMEVDGDVVEESFSVPGFLRKVFTEELSDDGGRSHKLTVIAVHAVMLESGFVCFDEKANDAVNGFPFRNQWPSGLFALSLSYTLPESLSSGGNGEAVKTVALKFQSLGKFMNVYGSGKKGTHWVRLNEDQLVTFLNVVWANCENINGGEDNNGTSPEKEVFNFWRSVKDNIALPLLIDLCEESGFELPPCLMRLPTELKLKILESLPGVDVAKMSLVCSEFRYLASSDDVWKLKFTEEFSNETKGAQVSWKTAFSTAAWGRKQGSKNAAANWPGSYWPQPRRRRYRSPFMVPRMPRIIGGEYDIVPGYGDDLQMRLHDPVNNPMRRFSPVCNLGVRGGRFV